MRFVAICGLAVLALWLLDRLALWAEARGFIYWRRSKPTGSALGGAFLELDSFLDPGARHIVETREAEPMEQTSDDDMVPPQRPQAPPQRPGNPG
jgi:hypothetical protein